MMTKNHKADKKTTSKKRPRGRAKGARITVQPLNVISALKIRLGLIGEILTFEDIAKKLTERSGITITRATVWRFSKGIEPSGARLRKAFSLPVRVPVAVCPDCGEPPLSKKHKCKNKTLTRPQVSLYFDKNKPLTLGAPAADCDSWLSSNAAELARRVTWAEGLKTGA